jgi:hypothetical protein
MQQRGVARATKRSILVFLDTTRKLHICGARFLNYVAHIPCATKVTPLNFISMAHIYFKSWASSNIFFGTPMTFINQTTLTSPTNKEIIELGCSSNQHSVEKNIRS